MERVLKFLLSVGIALGIAFFVPESDLLPPAARRALFILILAGALWVTEAMPAFAVGILVIALQILLLGKAGGVYAQTAKDWEQFVAVIGHPLVWLFFGGFVLAAGMAATGIDRWLAGRILHRFGSDSSRLLVGLMITTFGLSMIMSNTATTAMMLAVLGPVLVTAGRSETSRALVLGVAVAANLGGMASLIGTPPNAIAVGALADMSDGVDISFLDWLLIGLPPALVLLAIAWGAIRLMFKMDSSQSLSLTVGAANDDEAAVPKWQTVVVTSTLLFTVGLWLSTEWHRAPTAVISFVPIVVFTATGILSAKRIRGLPYDVLFLLAGGLALGQLVTNTGLSVWIANLLPADGWPPLMLALVIAYMTVLLSNFMSNTAAATILVPIGITIAVGFEAPTAVAVALGASAAMLLPVATPPNAMAFASGYCETRDFLRLGGFIGVIAPPLAILWIATILAFV